MIDIKNTSIALKNLAKATADTEGVTITGSYSYQPQANEKYVVDTVLFGDDSPIGMASGSRDIEYGIYQLSVRVPKNLPDNDCLDLSTAFRSAFTRVSVLSYGGQSLKIERTSKTGIRYSDTHKMIDLSFTYSVIA